MFIEWLGLACIAGAGIGLVGTLKDEKKEKVLTEERKKKQEEEAKAREMAKKKKYCHLVQIMPDADTIIEYDFDKYVMLKESSSQIMLNEHIYLFKDIVDFTINDNQTEIKRGGESVSTTRSSNGNMFGRAVVGRMFFGRIGAAIGAATAKKDTITYQDDTYSTTLHSYTITVTIDSLTSPTETLVLNNDEDSTNKVVSILTIILRRNEQSK